MFYFSKDLVVILKNLDEKRRGEILAAIRQRLRCADMYKILTLSLGFLGLHKLYIKEKAGMILRLNYLAAALVAAVCGIYFSDFYMMGLAAGLTVLVGGLWLYDIATPQLAMQRYHSRIEQRLVKWSRGEMGS